VRVAHASAIHNVCHLHTRMQLIGLHLHSEDGDLRSFHIGQHRGRHVNEGTGGQVLEHEGIPRATTLGQLRAECGGDGLGDAIGDKSDLLSRIYAQAGGDRRTGAGRELGGIAQ
jgi:hypothetical protein